MISEVIVQITAVCALSGTYTTPEIMLLAYEKQAECHRYYAKCMREKHGGLEWDYLENCMAERVVNKKPTK